MNIKKLFISILIGTIGITTTPIISKQSTPKLWDWKKINPLEVNFPESFLWGTTTLAYEVEGNCINNTWYLQKKETKNDGTPWAKHQLDNTYDHWHCYKQNIQKMKKMGLKAYCFSLSWDKIEPFEEHFNETAIQHYIDVCDELIKHDIKPIIILKDYRDPVWFAYMGGFEKEKNIFYFVRFCTTIFKKFHNKVDQWITFQSPEVYAINGYYRGSIPPCKKNMPIHFTPALNVLKNMLEAHVQVYQAGKKINDNHTKIGITKHIYPIKPWNKFNPLDHLACWMKDKLMNEIVFNFFTTGIFSPKKLAPSINHKNAYASKSLDFIGINYFSHGYMNNFKVMNASDKIPTDIGIYSICPEGLYQAIEEVNKNIAQPLDIPMYITQNGIATTDASTQDFFLKRHLYALSKAINDDSFDVRGYFYYTFMDCYTWGSYDTKMGLLTKERDLKEGAQYFIDIVNGKSTVHG